MVKKFIADDASGKFARVATDKLQPVSGSEPPPKPVALEQTSITAVPPDKTPDRLKKVSKPTSPRRAKPKKKTDVGLFCGIASLIFSPLFYTLQANGVVEINWILSCAVYLLCLGVLVWSLRTHAIPHLTRIPRAVVIYPTIGLFLWLCFYATNKQYERDHPVQNPRDKNKEMLRPSIHDLFLTDFPLLSVNYSAEVGSSDGRGSAVPVEIRVWHDLRSRAKFVGIYVPYTPRTFEVLKAVTDPYAAIKKAPIQSFTAPANTAEATMMELAAKDNVFVGVRFKIPGDSSPIDPLDFPFTGSIYLYYETALSASQIGELETAFRANKLSPQFRGSDYLIIRRNELEKSGRGISPADPNSRTVQFTSAPAPSASVPNVAPDTDQRPWITIDDVAFASALTYDAQGDARITVNFTLTNVGRLPAANVVISPEIVLVFGDPFPDQKRIADQQRSRSPALGKLGDTLFPGRTIVRAFNLPISRGMIQSFNEKMNKDFNEVDAAKGSLMASLVGCVDYKFTSGGGHHQTGFAFDLRVRDANNRDSILTLNTQDLPVPADRLVLVPSLGGALNVPPD